ncbi:MAG TPA: metallophosphoesterase, partial [Thermoanaerobaculia bacterium]|nr:metallophosphoesterase [Thermoanaerobaculia bacterium]
RESNPEEREKIVAAVAAGRPDFAVLLGDLVVSGSSAREWAEFDRAISPLSAAGVPILPILGNHEYWMAGAPSLRRYFARFPALGERRWYSARYGTLGLVLLDSNRRFLGRRAWEEELRWYDEELARLDADPRIFGVLVFSHHPPFTNSRVTGDERHVQSHLLPPMIATAKALAMFSGHVHSYERFSRRGKLFVVSGGAGAPRAPLATGGRRRHADDLFAGGVRRAFHFLRGEIGATGVSFDVVGLEKGSAEAAVIDRFALDWPAR